MNKRLALLMLVLLPLMACNKQDADAVATTDATTPVAGAAPTAEASVTPPAEDPNIAAAADAIAASAATAAAAGPALVPGTDYSEIPNGQPYRPLDGKIEVVEVFAYWCGHCASFQPLVDAWKRKLPADVRFTYVPLSGGPADSLSRAYFAAETSNQLDKTHNAIFNAIHLNRTLTQRPTPEEIAAVVGKEGVDGKTFADAMNGFAIGGHLNRAQQFAMRSGVDSTPTLVVDGKYRVQGKTLEDALRIANQLIAQQRAAKS
ncbi:MAG: thiol:disulfide interchange protein DsbA/DsbL [Pseudomonadota bacterium]|nr:thiol:disulfide interchange protein DsbA/DsbL [Pseudomonadota bacterium]MDQ3229796.1 thiol:disulfide interchange protein DsbA/DsbL [Pseudomonadota bacterium]